VEALSFQFHDDRSFRPIRRRLAFQIKREAKGIQRENFEIA
jgi:hypothetical protein